MRCDVLSLFLNKGITIAFLALFRHLFTLKKLKPETLVIIKGINMVKCISISLLFASYTSERCTQIKDHTEMCKFDFIVSLHYEHSVSLHFDT